MKRLSLLAVPLLLAGLLAGCGGDDSSASAAAQPGSATSGSRSAGESSAAGGSVEAFCNVLIGILQQPPQGSSDADALKFLKAVAAQLEQVGTPADMPEDAARALQNAIDKINALPDDATRDEVDKAAADLSKQEKKDQQALGQYVQSTCMPALEPSDGASSSG